MQGEAELFSSNLIAILLVNSSGNIVDANQKSAAMWGCGTEGFNGDGLAGMFCADDWQKHAGNINRLLAGQQESYRMECRCLRSDNSIFWGDCYVRAIDQGETVRHILLEIADITEKKRIEDKLAQYEMTVTDMKKIAVFLQDSEERLKLALEVGGYSIWEIDLRNRKLSSPIQLWTNLGWDEADFSTVLEQILALIHPEDLANVRIEFKRHLKGATNQLNAEFRLKTAYGNWIWHSAVGKVFEMDDNNKPARILGIVANITRRKQTEAKLYELATTDSLTGLFNRRHFLELCSREFSRAKRLGYILSLLMIDADNFKGINDTFGHDVGDRVLRALAYALRTNVREADICGRLGGEEFAVLLPGAEGQEACQIAERVRQATEETVIAEKGRVIPLSISIGVATSSVLADKLDLLLKNADSALYAAKESGRNRIEFLAQ